MHILPNYSINQQKNRKHTRFQKYFIVPTLMLVYTVNVQRICEELLYYANATTSLNKLYLAMLSGNFAPSCIGATVDTGAPIWTLAIQASFTVHTRKTDV